MGDTRSNHTTLAFNIIMESVVSIDGRCIEINHTMKTQLDSKNLILY